MARETRDIAYPIAFAGFILLVMTILVIDPTRMNGLTLAKYFWFYSTLLLTGVITFGLAFYSMSVASIDITKSIMIGILTVVIIDISRYSNMEMMNAKIFLLVIISFFFFDIFFHHYKKATKVFQFVLIAFALLEVIWGYCQLYAYIPDMQKDFTLTGSLPHTNSYAMFLAITLPIALYWTITLFQKLKYGYSRLLTGTDEEHVRLEIVDDILLFLLSALGLIGILSILPFTGIPSAWFIAGCSGLFVLYFKLDLHSFIKASILRSHKRTAISGITLLLVIGLLTTGFYRLRKDEINEHLLTWKISLQVLKEKPIIGVGIGNFRKAFGDAQTIYFEQGEPTEQEVALAGNPNCPVNDFIQLATGTGIIGILLFIGLIVSVLFSGFRNMDKHPEKLAITGALIAFILAGFINSPIQSLSLSILLVLLIALGTSDIQPARKRIPKVIPIMTSLLLIGITTTIVYPQFTMFKAYKQWAHGRLYYKMKIYATAAKIYTPLTNTLRHPYFFMEYGYALSQTGQHEESIAILQRVAQILPDPQIYNRIGKSYQALGEYQLAEQYFQKAHHMVPNLVYPNFLLAQLYLEMGLRDKTLECARQILTLKPKKESEETLYIKAQMEQLIQRLD